ncbi:MAG: hypothetical protein HGA96_17765 [Desulfobulbaceae bacterium]|nr:hypothetical protein [Desulfobulbaceae bacterium]
MTKIDYKKELPHLYTASAKTVEIVAVPSLNFLMLDGTGDPNSVKAFPEAIEALFGVAYTLKFMIKKGAAGVDYGVMPLEGLWWAEDMPRFSPDRKDDWLWTLMIRQPDLVTRELVEEAVAQVRKKKNPVALAQLRYEAFAEGRAAQILHVGPFSEEGPAIQKVHEFIQAAGGALTGKHHEIYLSDNRRAAPEKWKTIIRQPLAG